MLSGPNWAANGYKTTTIAVASQAISITKRSGNAFTFKVDTSLNSAPIPTLTYSHLMAECLCTLAATRVFELKQHLKLREILSAGESGIYGDGGRIGREGTIFPRASVDATRNVGRGVDKRKLHMSFYTTLPLTLAACDSRKPCVTLYRQRSYTLALNNHIEAHFERSRASSARCEGDVG